MDDNNKQSAIVELKTKISNLEHELQAAKRALFELGDTGSGASTSSTGRVIEGNFNGENMEGPDGKIFPVPANYASKSKLVEGDRLKLTIGDDGSFLFKQIRPTDRKKAIGTLKFENNTYVVEAENGSYHVLYASVTYYKAKPGDKVSIVLPTSVPEPKWCTLEGIIHDISTEDRLAAQVIAEERLAEEMKRPAGMTPSEPVNNFGFSEPLTDHDIAKNNLKIDDLEISGPKGQGTPEAVNPQEYVAPPVPQAPLSNSTTTDTRADAIQELEI